jgi:hypothetical protein
MYTELKQICCVLHAYDYKIYIFICIHLFTYIILCMQKNKDLHTFIKMSSIWSYIAAKHANNIYVYNTHLHMHICIYLR